MRPARATAAGMPTPTPTPIATPLLELELEAAGVELLLGETEAFGEVEEREDVVDEAEVVAIEELLLLVLVLAM